jgi:hypothetical protein
LDSGYFGVSKRHQAQIALNTEFIKLKNVIESYLSDKQ